MKIACCLIILVVGLAAVHGAKLRSREKEAVMGDDKLQQLRSRLGKIMAEKRNAAPATTNSVNAKRVLGLPGHGGCHVHDFIYLFTSLPEIRDALYELGDPEQVIAIVEEMALVFGKLQTIMNQGADFIPASPPTPLR